MGCPGIWLNTISGCACEAVSVWDEHLNKCSNVVGSIQSIEGLNKAKSEERGGIHTHSPPEEFSLDIHLLPEDWESYRWLPWFSGLQTWPAQNRQLSWVSSVQTADHGTFQSPKLLEPIPITNIHIFPICSVSMENPNSGSLSQLERSTSGVDKARHKQKECMEKAQCLKTAHAPFLWQF